MPALPFCRVHLRGQKPVPPTYPMELQTVGDHLRTRRLDLGLWQRHAADRIGVTESTLWNWENGKAKPALRRLPSILRFLGYDPRPAPRTVGQMLERYRHGCGMTQQQLAIRLKVDPSTLARWEREERIPVGDFLRRVQWLLRSAEA